MSDTITAIARKRMQMMNATLMNFCVRGSILSTKANVIVSVRKKMGRIYIQEQVVQRRKWGEN